MKPTKIDVHEHREPDYPVEELFLRRWSSRALSGEPLSEEDLGSLFEAARWAPSSYNGQPWRFLYARRDGEHWDELFDLMVEYNQGWAKGAGGLIVVLSRKTFEHNDKPARTHSFDAGAAWMALALQAAARGLVAHAMQGFDYDRAREVLEIPEEYEVECMVAVGHPGEISELPEKLRERDKPSSRKAVSELAFEGRLPG